MSNKHSLANKKKWASISPEERSKRMSKIAKDRMKSLTSAQRKKIGRNLTKAREAKRV